MHNLQIRRYPYELPDRFRSVRDLGGRPCPQAMFVRTLGRWFAPVAPSTSTPWPSSPTLGPSTGAVTAPCPAQTPPPNPDCCRTLRQTVLSGVRVADHEVTLKAPWTGSGWREHSYGGFGGGHSPFHRAFRLRQGSYYPEWLLERRRRAERTLASVVATSYLLGHAAGGETGGVPWRDEAEQVPGQRDGGGAG